MDPLSITASAAGIIVPALHGTRLLLEDMQQLKDAPKTIKRLTEDVHSVYTALELLRGVGSGDWKSLGQNVAEQWKTDGLDRANAGFVKKNEAKAMSEQLQICKLAINFIVEVAPLYSSVRNGHAREEMKKTISVKQAELKSATTTADRQLAVVENKLEEPNLNSDDDDTARSSEGKDEVMRQLEEELKGAKSSQKLLNDLLSKSQEVIGKAVEI
ncbi:hypothetical protein BJ878DRAFT_581340 [Calycina marina]|uniref:Fungal N-terminal domain-containing protein n=1 Tax=Calycina marina TaxID=1763456 RepID=A0A9P8CGP5_9HELO|nr:hypothetical protein BJ878DRAFT_581340 [Calycina marina]